MMGWFYISIERKGCRFIIINHPSYVMLSDFGILGLIVKDMGKYLVEQNLLISHQSEMSFTQDRPSTDDLPLLIGFRQI